MPHGFVYTAHGIVNARFPSVYSPLRYSGARGDPRFAGLRDDEAEIVAAYGSQSNEADILTVAFRRCKMSLGVFCLGCDNTAISNCLHLLWDGALSLWQKLTQFSLLIQSIYRYLELLAPSVA
jgi:hypothetical protein